MFGDVDRVREAKWELVESLGAGGTAVLPAGEQSLLRRRRGPVLSFGEEPGADVRVEAIRIDEVGRAEFTLVHDGERAAVAMTAAGRHQPHNAAAAVAEIISKGIVPSVMEFMDGDSVVCSNAYEKSIDVENANAILLCETTGQMAHKEADKIENIGRSNNTFYLVRENCKSKADFLWKIRRNLSKAVKESAILKISEDVCVPPSRLPELVAFVSRLNNEYSVRINSYGHAGDGNLHPTILFDSRDQEESERVHQACEEILAVCVEMGGTITGEHGVGTEKMSAMSLLFDQQDIDAMLMLKRAFDPHDLCNPGKIFP